LNRTCRPLFQMNSPLIVIILLNKIDYLFLNEFFRFKCNCIACTKQWPMHEFLTKTVTKPGTQQKTTSFSNILNFKNLYCVENPQNKNFPDQNRFLKCFFFISRL